MTIQPGDLVYMAHRICDCAICRIPIGIPFVVSSVHGTDRIPVYCASNWSKAIATAPCALGFPGYQIPVSVLNKIDPPAIDESTPTVEELTA